MVDNADPSHGWSLKEVSNTTSGAATADIYGKLFFYIRGILDSFIDRIFGAKMSFQLLHLDASSLPDHLDQDSFSRIDVSSQANIWKRQFYIVSTYLRDSSPSSIYIQTLMLFYRFPTSRIGPGWEYIEHCTTWYLCFNLQHKTHMLHL